MTQARPSSGFTLVELIIVMALLATVMAFSAPALGRTMRQRNLDQEAARFVALTEYGRDEAVSQGIPMTVWIDPGTQRFGVEAHAGFTGTASRTREYRLNADVHFELDQAVPNSSGLVVVAEFSPEGTPGSLSLETLRMVDRFESGVTVQMGTDRWGYTIVKEVQ